MSVEQEFLEAILNLDGYISLGDNGTLVIDGSLELTEEQIAWYRDWVERMRPIWDEESRRYWRKAVDDRIERALAGDTEARERLSYFARRESGYAKEFSIAALREHNLDRTV